MATPSDDWEPDCELGPGYVQKPLRFDDDYDGRVIATLVRSDSPVPPEKRKRSAVLYIHGFIDHFFQKHVAHEFMCQDYNFYGLDLRKYGRSRQGAVHPWFCFRFEEYFEEITAAIEIIREEGHSGVILYAHSTGALPAALYAKDGIGCAFVDRIILNSPFLDFKEHGPGPYIASWLGQWFHFWEKKKPVSGWYGRSLHTAYLYGGEWTFNLDWKPVDGAVAYFGWIRAVVRAHKRIKRGLGLSQPILVLHSDASSSDGPIWREEYKRTDLVLDVGDMRRLSGKLGSTITRVEIAGAVHDVVLSAPEVREKAITEMLDWLSRPM